MAEALLGDSYPRHLTSLTLPDGTLVYIRSAKDPMSLRGLCVGWMWIDGRAWARTDAMDCARLALRDAPRRMVLDIEELRALLSA